MKTRLTLFIFLFTATFLTAQNAPSVRHRKKISIDPTTNQSVPVYECIAPTDFDTHIFPNGKDEYMLYLTWDMQSQYGEWMHWDDGVQFSGTGSWDDMTAAAKWDSSQLAPYQNFRLKKMRIILNDMSAYTVIFKVWNGMNESDLIYKDSISEYQDGVWVNHSFTTDLFVDSSKDLLIGYTALCVVGGNFPCGLDNGPAITGYGDLIKAENNPTWDTLSLFGLDYNWNIQLFVEDTSGVEQKIISSSDKQSMEFLGYNLYQNINGDAYELLEFIPAEYDSNFYSLPIGASNDERCYKLTALWMSPTDTCESEPAISRDDPSADSVCVLIVGTEATARNKSFKCYPNPLKTSTTFEYELSQPERVTITFYNYFGKVVDKVKKTQKKGLNKIVWTPKHLANGVYFFRFKAGDKITTGKVVKED